MLHDQLSVQHKGGPSGPPLAFSEPSGPQALKPSSPQALKPSEVNPEGQLRQSHESRLRPRLPERGAADGLGRSEHLDGVGDVQHFETDFGARAAANRNRLGGYEVPVV